MKYRKCTISDLFFALNTINKKYNNNVDFRRLDSSTKSFTLKVKDSKGPGHRLSLPRFGKNNKQIRMPYACWHVHGDFFDALFKICPDAYVISQGKRIDKLQGNWEDRNIGSMIEPFFFSEACECHSRMYNKYGPKSMYDWLERKDMPQ